MIILLNIMNGEFQQLYNFFKSPMEPKKRSIPGISKKLQKAFYTIVNIWSHPDSAELSELIFEKIGKDKFSAIMDMKYAQVTSIINHHSAEFGRFYNKFWEFSVLLETQEYSFAGVFITSKNVGSYYFSVPDKNRKILKEWLEYFRGQCKKNGIKITDF